VIGAGNESKKKRNLDPSKFECPTHWCLFSSRPAFAPDASPELLPGPRLAQSSAWAQFRRTQPPNVCAFAFNYVGGPLITTNGSVEMVYAESVPAHGSKTGTMIYKGF